MFLSRSLLGLEYLKIIFYTSLQNMNSLRIISLSTLILFILISIKGCVMSDMPEVVQENMPGVVQEKFFTKKFDTINYHKSDEYINSRLQRVLLLPFTIESNRDKVVNEVTKAFFIELQKISKFSVVIPREFEDMLLQQKDIWTRGLIRSETIVEAKKRYNVDAIIFGTVTQYQPYEPPVLGIKIGMFSTNSGNLMWCADAIFDSREASVIKLLKNYYKDHYQRKQSLYDWEILLLSMKRYAQFVAYHILGTL